MRTYSQFEPDANLIHKIVDALKSVNASTSFIETFYFNTSIMMGGGANQKDMVHMMLGFFLEYNRLGIL